MIRNALSLKHPTRSELLGRTPPSGWNLSWRTWLAGVQNYHWLVVYLPLWKLWVRQLGWWHSQNMENKIHVPNHQPDHNVVKKCIFYTFSFGCSGYIIANYPKHTIYDASILSNTSDHMLLHKLPIIWLCLKVGNPLSHLLIIIVPR